MPERPAFHTIGEVADELELPQHTLRFWEKRFWQIQPLRRTHGRRFYRAEDVALLAGIRRLIHFDHISIRGVQKILRDQGVDYVRRVGNGCDFPPHAAQIDR